MARTRNQYGVQSVKKSKKVQEQEASGLQFFKDSDSLVRKSTDEVLYMRFL